MSIHGGKSDEEYQRGWDGKFSGVGCGVGSLVAELTFRLDLS